jgi:hypothetical protein
LEGDGWAAPGLSTDASAALTRAVSHRGLAIPRRGAPNVNRVCAVQDGWHQRARAILINPAHVRTVRQSGSAQVTLVMDDGEGGGYQNVEGDLKSVWEKLTGKVTTLEALEEHLTWTRRDPEVD